MLSLRQRWHQFLTNRLRTWLGVPSVIDLEFQLARRILQTREEGEAWNAKVEKKRQELEAFASKLRFQQEDISRRYEELRKATEQIERVAGAMTVDLSDSAIELQKYVLAIQSLSLKERGVE